MLEKLINRIKENRIKENKINKDILKDEAKFLKDTDRYDFFGYFRDEERELPVFITEGKVEDDCRMGEFIYVYTPKMLKHCVKYLTEDAKLKEAQDIEYFKKKCNKLAERAIYQEESWEGMISSLVSYLQEFKKAKDYEAKVLANNDTFDKFDGVLNDVDNIPQFYSYNDELTNGHLDLKCYENWIATPKILKHCVEHLSDDAKHHEATYIADFMYKCISLMFLDSDKLFLEQEWDDTLDILVDYLEEYKKANENNV